MSDRWGIPFGSEPIKIMNNKKLEDFDGDEQLAAEYSDTDGCPISDSGYHCSCYDKFNNCCLCEGIKE